ncbi:MAG TPA: septal ring lytic transglycosylase RlpA family protein [Burkholderiaceae bacterium]|nr:septal ring lytic transglycosylase RlpA family protein [Burkholderiaceae bacterium]
MHDAAGRRWTRVALALTVLALVGCASTRRSGRDGPGANPPPNLAQVPDAEPRLEPLRNGGPNKPYEVFGRTYAPLTRDAPFSERGLASWYGTKFQGRPTSSGEPYDMYAMTAAHKTMPIPSYARVRNPANGREVIVRINDRGPFHDGRVIDLSYTAALKLGVLNAVAPVEVERITQESIRSGAWRAGSERALAAAPAQATPPPGPSVASAAAPPAPGTAPPTVSVPEVPSASITTVAIAPAPGGAVDTTVAEAAPGADDEVPRPPPRPIALAPPGFWLQLGAFRERDGALDFQRKVERELDWLAPSLAVFTDRDLHRLQAGPYRTRSDASGAADRLRAELQLVPLIVERR